MTLAKAVRMSLCDSEGSELLLTEFRKRLVRLAVWYGYESPEDIAHDTITKILEEYSHEVLAHAVDDVPTRQSIENRMLRLFLNRGRNSRKRRSRQRMLLENNRDRFRKDKEDTVPYDHIRTREIVDVMHSVIRHKLSPHYQEVLLLRFWDEMTLAQAADQLAISKDAFSGRLQRAKQQLADELRLLDIDGDTTEELHFREATT